MDPPDYLYLADSPLTMSLLDLDPDTAEIFLCLFSHTPSFQIDREAKPIPYLKFLVQKDTEYVFPTLDAPSLEPEDDVDERFQSDATTRILDLLHLHVTPNVQVEWAKMFRGFLQHHGRRIAFFHYDEIMRMFTGDSNISDENPDREFRWAIVDEIVFERAVLETPVLLEIADAFLEHPLVWNISYDGTYIDFPFSVYLRNDADETERIAPVREDALNRLHRLVDNMTKCKTYPHANDFGDRYCFSADSEVVPAEDRFRCAIYPHQIIYDTCVEEDEDPERQVEKMHTPTLCYKVNGKPRWGVLRRGQIARL